MNRIFNGLTFGLLALGLLPEPSAMDIIRTDFVEKRRRKRIILIAAGILGVGLVSVGVSRLKPADPTVEKGTVWIDTVRRGTMLRQVRGPGTLVPIDIRWITTATDGRVERIQIFPGTVVLADSVILELSNPELAQATRDAELQYRASSAEQSALAVKLENERLDQQAGAATVKADFRHAKLELEMDEKLANEGIVSALALDLARARAEELARRQEIEEKRAVISKEAVEAQMSAEKARVDQLREAWMLRRSQLDALHVRAAISGVLQQVPVEVGQRVTAGTNLARVAEPHALKAVLRINETQAKDVVLGQKVSIDTRNGIVPGHVIRIDPAVQNGTVAVDVLPDAAMPAGARPDLSIDGTIEIERLADVLYVGRPAFGQEGEKIGLFKLLDDGRAVRTPVTLGRGSVTSVEVRSGLLAGDRVILSDMSAWDGHDAVRLK